MMRRTGPMPPMDIWYSGFPHCPSYRHISDSSTKTEVPLSPLSKSASAQKLPQRLERTIPVRRIGLVLGHPRPRGRTIRRRLRPLQCTARPCRSAPRYPSQPPYESSGNVAFHKSAETGLSIKKMVRNRTKRHHASWRGGKWQTRRAKTPTTSIPASLTNLIRVRDQDRGQPANLRCKIDADKSHSKWHRLTSARQSEIGGAAIASLTITPVPPRYRPNSMRPRRWSWVCLIRKSCCT